ncbi:MAG: hypothetical protein DKM50_11005 [Candidatus Margulisiibacteriota bacterium]|nr:MAG: hypothetical protein DKM50_11005 [Candidatus Margulisiibacteriota bacterium]HCY38030.1 hypothetical protein [Candidatus Margulisiibacteriota bacterium]
MGRLDQNNDIEDFVVNPIELPEQNKLLRDFFPFIEKVLSSQDNSVLHEQSPNPTQRKGSIDLTEVLIHQEKKLNISYLMDFLEKKRVAVPSSLIGEDNKTSPIIKQERKPTILVPWIKKLIRELREFPTKIRKYQEKSISRPITRMAEAENLTNKQIIINTIRQRIELEQQMRSKEPGGGLKKVMQASVGAIPRQEIISTDKCSEDEIGDISEKEGLAREILKRDQTQNSNKQQKQRLQDILSREIKREDNVII